MVVAVIILAIAVVVLAYFYATVRINNHYLCVDFGNVVEQKDRDYAALEQGRDEESDSYEQQFLTFMETIENQSTAINSYIEDLHFLVGIVRTHMDDCLPVISGDLEDRERFLAIEQGIILQTDG